MRKEAENQLGSIFDIRDFHSICLNSGAIPLTILNNKIQEFIKQNLENDRLKLWINIIIKYIKINKLKILYFKKIKIFSPF